MQRYKNNKWWSMRPSDDGNYVAYHEHKETVEMLQAKVLEKESEAVQSNNYAKVWQNMYEYEKNLRVETTKENNRLADKLMDAYGMLLISWIIFIAVTTCLVVR